MSFIFHGVKARLVARAASIRKQLESGGAVDRLSLRRQISVFLICAGLALLLLAAGAYGWMYLEQRRLVAQWQSPDLHSAPQSQQDSGLTFLYIPKINLRVAVLEGTDRKSLLLAPGHLKDTAWPGEAGNAVLAGHRDTFFRHLPELVKGDDIYVRRNGREYHYVVSRKAIVSPTDIQVTRPTPDNRLTLITCYPTYYIGPAPDRLIIVAGMQSDAPNPRLADSQSREVGANP